MRRPRRRGGRDGQAPRDASVASAAGKTVRCVQLPNVNDGVLPATVMHVLAVAAG